MRLSDEEVERLLREGESFRVERKESLTGGAANAIREAICAFANDLPGAGAPGIVFVGVSDAGRPTGLAVSDPLLQQLADMKTDGNIVPPPTLLVEKRIVAGAEVAVITVAPSDSPPVRYKGAIHVRVGPRRGLATAQDERILNEKRRSRSVAFDVQPIPGASANDLNLRLFEEEYLPAAFSPEVLAQNDRTVQERLAATKMIASLDNPAATVIGILALGKRPRDFVPSAYVQFLRIAGKELSDPIADEETIDGTLSETLRRVDQRLRAQITTRVDIGADLETRSASYPLSALQQIVRNAVMHRTYESTNAPVRLTWFDDRIEVWSPGGPFGVATIENFGRPGIVDYRNPNLAEAMRVLGFVQRFGVGIASARRWLREAGHPDLEYAVENNFIQAIIWGRSS